VGIHHVCLPVCALSEYEDDFGVTGTTHLLLLAIMWYIIDQKQRRLLILDDAYFTDEFSWAVIEDLVRK